MGVQPKVYLSPLGLPNKPAIETTIYGGATRPLGQPRPLAFPSRLTNLLNPQLHGSAKYRLGCYSIAN